MDCYQAGQMQSFAPKVNQDKDDQLPKLLEELREALKEDTQCLRRDDRFLTKFLRVRDYDLQRAHKSVKNYYKSAKDFDDLSHTQSQELILAYESHAIILLKGRCKLGSRIFLHQTWNWNVNDCSLATIMQMTMFFAEEIIQQKSTQLSGISLIIDFKGLSFAHLRTLTLKEIRRVVNGLQDGFPTKISGVHFVNYPTIFWSTFYLAQKFMKEKLRKRIHFHSTMETLHEFYDVNILPKTLDGELEQDQLMDKEILDKVLRENRELIDYFYSEV